MKRTISAAAVVLAAMCGEGAAFAQQPPSKPYPAVFGGVVADPNARQTLDLTVSLAEAYDDNLMADLGGLTPTPYQLSGVYSTLTPQLMFQNRGDRVQFSATGGSSVRYYSGVDQLFVMNHNVAAGASMKVTQSTSFFVNEAVAYAPAYLYGLFATRITPAAGDIVPGAADYQTASERAYTSSTVASLTHTVSPRATLTLTGDYRYTTFVGQAKGYVDLGAGDVGGNWTYSINRDFKLRLGYMFRQVRYSETLHPIEHDLDIGVDYSRPLSKTRRSTIGFSLGPTVISGPLTATDASSSNRFRLIGNAFLERQLGRTWRAKASYRRGLAYIEGLAGPVYTDAASAETGGFLNRRVDVTFSAAYSLGQLAAGATNAAKYSSYTGTGQLRVGLSRQWAAYVEGVYFDYTFDKALLVVPGLPNHFRRSGVRAGLTLWLPVRSR